MYTKMMKEKRQIRRPANKQTKVVAGKNRVSSSSQDNSLVATIKKEMQELAKLLKPNKFSKPSHNNAEIELKYKTLEQQLKLLSAENDSFKKDAEIRKIADERLKKERHQEKINSRIKVMIEKGAIASGDNDGIKHWTDLFNSNYDTTDKIVSSQLEKLGSSSSDVNKNSYTPSHQSIIDVGNKMASKYFTGDRSVFEPVLKN